MQDWPDVFQSSESFYHDFENRQTILWIMVKPNAEEAKVNPMLPFLCSKVLFSTCEYAGIPNSVIDLFLSLIEQIHRIWRGNFKIMSEHLAATVCRSTF